MKGFVYAIKPCGMPGPYKIGFSKLPVSRMDLLTTWSPFPLEIVATIPGSILLEQNIHDCLWNAHSHKEWFFATDRVVAFVKSIAAGVPVEDAINLEHRERPRGAYRKPWSETSRLRAKFSSRLRFAGEVPDDVQALVCRLNRGGQTEVLSAAEIARLEEALPVRRRA